MSGQWNDLALAHGRRSVMSLSISDQELDAETERQTPLLFGMIADQLHGHERTALDYGCGAGRFTIHLAKAIQGRAVGFDQCAPLIAQATGHISVDYHSGDAELFFAENARNGVTFDVILALNVMGAPGLNTEITAAGLVSLLAPDGLLVLCDHMTDEPQPRRWWRFRSRDFYKSLFAHQGVVLREIGTLMQLENEITVLAGRPTGGSPA